MSITFISCKIKEKGELFKEKIAKTNAQSRLRLAAPSKTVSIRKTQGGIRFNVSTLQLFNALNICPLDIPACGAKLAVYGFTTHK
jgi:hypothetical protein